MKYLLLLLGVAQAKDLLLKRRLSGSSGSLEWNFEDEDGTLIPQSHPCPAPGEELPSDVVHAAMCGQRLLTGSSECDTSGFIVGSVHAMNSGSCGSTARWYKIDSVDGGTRVIKRCGPDVDDGHGNGPICAKDVAKADVDIATCTESYDAKNAAGDHLNHPNWDVDLLCAKETGAILTADGSGSGSPPSCHGLGESSCQGQADCSWDPDAGTVGECHSSPTDSGPTCGYVVKNDSDLHDEFLQMFHYNEPVACTTAECNDMKSFYDILINEGISDIIDQTIQDIQTGGYTFDCCDNSMISLPDDQITDFMENTFVTADNIGLPISILEQINHFMKVDGIDSLCYNPSNTDGVTCDYNDIMGLLFHPQYSIFSQDTTAEIEACAVPTGPSDGSSDGPSEPPPCTGRYNHDDCVREDGRTCVWDGSSCDRHPCDTITSCEGDLVKKSPYPDANNINKTFYIHYAQCCKPERKGCKDDSTSYTYDPTVDVHDPSLCFTQESEADKAADVAAAVVRVPAVATALAVVVVMVDTCLAVVVLLGSGQFCPWP